MEKKEQFYTVSYQTGATRADSWIDIEGDLATCFPTHPYDGNCRIPRFAWMAILFR